jgi:chloride channel protein, CIC family
MNSDQSSSNLKPHRLSAIQFFAEAILGDLHRTIVPILLIGAGGAIMGLAYLTALRVLQRVLGPEYSGPWAHLAIMAAVGLTIGLIKRFLDNPGEMELLVDNIHVLGGHDDLRGSLRSLVPVSLLCIAAGGAAGPEAPLVQTTGSMGTWLAKRRGSSIEDTRVLTITGMAAGFTVLFGAPLGAAIFALEILHRRGLEYYEALLPAVLGSLCGYAVYVLATGWGLAPVWTFPTANALRGIDIAWSFAAGVAGAGVAVAFTYLTIGCRRVFERMPMIARSTVGGIVLGLLAMLSPFALKFGEIQLGALLTAPAVAMFFIIAILAKLIGTSVTVSSGWRGGFIIPLFFIGAALGRLWHMAVPSTNEVMLMAGLMVAINTGVTKTPLGSTLVVTEMAGLPLLPTTIVAAIVSLLLTSEVGLIHTQRRRSVPAGKTLTA